jgi:hypothetical protein
MILKELWKDEDISKVSDCGKAEGFTQFKTILKAGISWSLKNMLSQVRYSIFHLKSYP